MYKELTLEEVIIKNLSMSLNLILSRNRKLKQHIMKKAKILGNRWYIMMIVDEDGRL